MKLSLRVKIFFLIMVCFTIILALFLSYILEKETKLVTDNFKNLNQSSARILSKNVASNLYRLDYTRVKVTIDSFTNKFFKNIYILNKDGYIFAQRNKDEIIYQKFSNVDEYKKNYNLKKDVYFAPIFMSYELVGYLVFENDFNIINQLSYKKRIEFTQLFLLFFLLTIILSYFISFIITQPIFKITNTLLKTKTQDNLKIDYTFNDEFAYLSRTLENNHNLILEMNKSLQTKVKKEIDKNKEKDLVLQKQSLYASLGEMMDAIAHQWKQPLGVIRLKSQELYLVSNTRELTKEEIKNTSLDIDKQIIHLINTLDEFRGFFRPSKGEQIYNIKKVIESTIELLHDDIIFHNLNINLLCKPTNILINQNEFKHVFINLINNSKDAFIHKNINNRNIEIRVEVQKSEIIIYFSDNAGGISTNIIDSIFKVNVTNKKEGTGIGLYLSKLIIEKHQGLISVSNTLKGAEFKIILNKELNG